MRRHETEGKAVKDEQSLEIETGEAIVASFKPRQAELGAQASGIDLEVLATGVRRLRLKMERMEASECGQCKALINLAFAEREARAGNQTRAVNHLKKAGKPALDFAAKIGISVVSDAVRGPSRSRAGSWSASHGDGNLGSAKTGG